MLPQNNNFKITLASREDLPQILQIYEYARKFMRESGNASQWKEGFPPEDMLTEDIDAGQLYAVRDSKWGIVHGVFAFMTGEEPSYAYIERGKWLSDTEYGTLHRVAGDGKAHGIFDAIAKFCEQKISHLRIDTHEDNKVMQHLIEKNGFQRCGIIYVEDGSPRIAYEKIKDRVKNWQENDNELIAQAREAIRSNYDGINLNHTVGAAVRCGSGKIYTGVNVYSLHGACAEQVAIGAAITQGERDFEAIVAVRGKDGEEIIPPCGNCRQMLFDYMPECEVILMADGKNRKVKAKELLPFAYKVI